MSFAFVSRHGFWTAALLLAFATAMALVPLPWPMSLAEHFHLHYLAAAAVAALVAAALRQVTLADTCAVIALVNLVVIAPYLRAGAPVAASGATPVRVLLLNVHTASMQHAQVRQLIDDVAPDVVALVEVDRRWLDALEPSLRDYRGRLEKPRDDNFGIALYHRQPLLAGEIAAIGTSLPSVVARLDTGGAPLAVILTHPIPPVDVATDRANRAQLDAIGDRAGATSGARIVLGDFNATPWSRPFARLVARSGLRDSRDGFGVGASFPAALGALGIPIDHALVSAEVAVTARRIERDVGSDHLPVVLELAIAPAGARTNLDGILR
jgi:endonuclease/exonuclease/phosphatase (EEP) superfamily protein YafD